MGALVKEIGDSTKNALAVETRVGMSSNIKQESSRSRNLSWKSRLERRLSNNIFFGELLLASMSHLYISHDYHLLLHYLTSSSNTRTDLLSFRFRKVVLSKVWDFYIICLMWSSHFLFIICCTCITMFSFENFL